MVYMFPISNDLGKKNIFYDYFKTVYMHHSQTRSNI